MEAKFVPITKKEYTIVRDYFVSNDSVQGLYFLLYDESNNRLITRFLHKDDITDEQIWKKKKSWKKDVYTQIVEKGRGKENKVIVERGNLNIRKRNAFNEIVEKKKPAERIIFYLAPSVYKPF